MKQYVNPELDVFDDITDDLLTVSLAGQQSEEGDGIVVEW